MGLATKLANSRWAQVIMGVSAAEYLRLVWKTSRVTVEPADFYERTQPKLPVIVALWHGQNFMAPFLRRDHRVKTLVSRHFDGEISAIAAERLGIGTIRGSGDHQHRFEDKGGVPAFQSMVASLAEGWNVALTADVPKISRVAGLGIIMLARRSGRPIYPVSFTTSRRIVLNNWDRSTINLPFSRSAIVVGEPIRVPHDADAEALESARCALEAELNLVTERAHAIVDRKPQRAAQGSGPSRSEASDSQVRPARREAPPRPGLAHGHLKVNGKAIDAPRLDSDSEIIDEIRLIISRSLRIPTDQLTPNARLYDLGAESIDVIELVFALEERFDITIPFKANEGARRTKPQAKSADQAFSTVGNITNLVRYLVEAKTSS